jgi:2-polyprenyl-6-methoxyphenol hydroxylase-like FAD-dependent oxidoreductase
MRWRCDWIVGCDGARSIVRRTCALRFVGGTYRNEFYVVDARVDGDLPEGEVVPSLSHDAFALFVPMSGDRRYRVVGPFPVADDAGVHHDRDRVHDDDDVDEPGVATRGPDGGPIEFSAIEAAIRDRMDIDVRFSEVAWYSTYRVHHRCVERFRDGRCFVAGDSAHVHSPVGAQGMNTGLQDAANLGWKLALVVQGRASPGLLDSYHEERWPVAQSLLRTTDNAFRLVIGHSSCKERPVFVSTCFRARSKVRILPASVPYGRRAAPLPKVTVRPPISYWPSGSPAPRRPSVTRITPAGVFTSIRIFCTAGWTWTLSAISSQEISGRLSAAPTVPGLR